MFVGAKRVEAVDALERALESVVAGGGSRLVVLSAPTGFGKTRIVQEFYARIAASQPVPKYWPARIEGEGSLRWTESRKCVFPSSFVVPPGARLPWFWWGVSCGTRQDGRYSQALFDDVTQLDAHGGSIYDRLRGADVAGRSFDGTSALIGALGLLGVALVPPVAIGTTIVGGLRTLWQNKDLLERLRKWRTDRDRQTNQLAIDSKALGRDTQIVELAANLVTVSREVPVLLVVDDAHWADATLVHFMDHVLQNPQARVLVIATTWPLLDSDEPEEPFSVWLRTARHAAAHGHRIEVRALESLGEQDLAELVRAEYRVVAPDNAPPLSDAVISGVLDLVGVTPMGVRALFGLERTRHLIAEGGLTLQELGRLPRDLEDALRLYWDDIPEEVQTVLAMAAMAGFRFLPTPIIRAATEQGIDDAAGRLEQGENTYGFVRNIETGLATFVDPTFHDTAQREADDTFTRAQRDSLRQAIIDYALSVSLNQQTPVVCEAAWSAHLGLASDGFGSRTLAASSAANLAELSASRFDYLAAIDLGRRSLSWTAAPADDVQTLTLRTNLAGWLRLAGRLDEAVRAGRDLIEVLCEIPASSDRDGRLVRAHLELAVSLKQQQQLDAALDETGKAADSFGTLADSDQSADSLRRLVKRTQAACLGERSETVDQAIELIEALLADEGDPPAPYDERMRLRQDLGSLYGDQRVPSAVRLAKSITMFKQLRQDRERVLGATDPATLETTHSLAYVLAVSGAEFLPESLELFTHVARERDNVLGPENPETLRTRQCVAWVNTELGEIELALRQYQSLLIDSRMFLGQEHHDVKHAADALEELRAHTRETAARTFLLAEVLKPRKGETLAQLRVRADETSSSVPSGAEALAALGERDPARAHRYRTLTWTRRRLPLRELRVWPGMGGLPHSWCDGSVVDVAHRLRREELPEQANRLKDLLSLVGSIDHDELAEWMSYLPLLVVADTLLHKRPPLPHAPWALDDGCHRAIVLGLLDVDSVSALVGARS